MSNPLFSIITICYNSESTIERTIQSVLAQSFTDYEYIIVDGASKDSTIEIIRKFEREFDGRLKWSSEPDKGIYNAMNKGIERSHGSIIGIVNSDDWLEPDALEKVNQAYISNKRDNNTLYCGGIIFHTTQGAKRYLKADKEVFLKNTRYYVLAGIRHPATFVPSDVYKKIGTFDERIKIAADADFILRCKNQGVNIYVMDMHISNMSDGGLSNRKGIYNLGENDRRLILKKNGVKGLRYCFQMLYWIVRKKTKGLLLKMSLYRIS